MKASRSESARRESHAAQGPKRKRRGSPLVRALWRKFVVFSMLAVVLVLSGLIATIDISSYLRLCKRADAQLDAIVVSGGSFDDLVSHASEIGKNPPPSSSSSSSSSGSGAEGAGDDSPSDSPESTPEDNDEPDKDSHAPSSSWLSDIFGDLGFSEDTPYEMRYFTVQTDADGNVVSTDTSRISSIDDEGAAEYAQTVADSGKTSGFVGNMRFSVSESSDGTTLYAFLSCTRDLSSFKSLLVASILVLVLTVILVFILVVLLSGRAVAPVAESYERQRRFITNASHDLKTPLAVIGSSVDVIEIENGQSEWTESIRHQVARMSDLTNKLVMLARMDEGDNALTLTETDVAALARQVADDFCPVAVASGKQIKVDGDKSVMGKVDASLVEQALVLLLDNALKYSPDGETISLKCDAGKRGRPRIAVENPCDPVEPGVHSELFERFYRADASRSSSGGHGIGLAVVRAIAEAHGGSVQAFSPDGSSMRITLQL